MEKKIETTIVYWGYIRIMEKIMETTIVAHSERSQVILTDGFGSACRIWHMVVRVHITVYYSLSSSQKNPEADAAVEGLDRSVILHCKKTKP